MPEARGRATKGYAPLRLPGNSVRALLGLVVLLFALGGKGAAPDAARDDPVYTRAELERQAAEWVSFNTQVQQEALSLLGKVPPLKGTFGPEPPKSWKWWDERGTIAGQAIRARVLRWLRAHPMMAGASDMNLWFTMLLLEGSARLAGKIEELESRLPENAPYASEFGVGSERERFHLFTGCRHLLPLVTVEDEGAFADSVRAAVESRLRGARLYSDDDPRGLVLRVNVERGDGSTFVIELGLLKPLFDPITGLSSYAHAVLGGGRRYGIYGTGHQGSIREGVADIVDRFINDYLRVNAEACGGLGPRG